MKFNIESTLAVVFGEVSLFLFAGKDLIFLSFKTILLASLGAIASLLMKDLYNYVKKKLFK